MSVSMGTSTLTGRSTAGSNSYHHTTRRKHGHKKHKKHRRDKIRRKLTSEHSRSRTNSTDGNKAPFENSFIDYGSTGDYLKKGDEFPVHLEEMPDFTWLTTEFKFSDISDTFESNGIDTNLCSDIISPEAELSQRMAPSSHKLTIKKDSINRRDERSLIEKEIKEKYAEMNVLIEKIHSKRHRSRRRRKYHLRKYDSTNSCGCGPCLSTTVNISPIKREKRCAQPIREALLVRSAMRKTWKGLLGSCCGKGCWATWKWTSLRGVISDYE